MNSRRFRPPMLTTMLLVPALVLGILTVACADIETPTALVAEAGIQVSSHSFPKPVFKPCKPHLNDEERGPPLELVVVAPDQSVEVDLGDHRRADGRFRSQLLVGVDGEACGQAQLEFEEPYDEGGTGILVYLIHFSGATLRAAGGLRVVEFDGVAEVCSEREGEECETVPMTGTVSEQPNDDEPIWQLHGGGAYSFSAQTRFITPGGDDRGSVRGSFPEQTAEVRAPRGEGGLHIFQADFWIEADGTASGGAQLSDITDPAGPALRFHITQGRFAVSPEGVRVVWLSGIVVVVGEGRTEEQRFAATVLQQPTDDEPIWQYHAGGVHGARFPAMGDLVVLP